MKRSIAAAVAAVAVVAIVLVLILAYGVVRFPDYPLLAADPDPAIEGTVAFVGSDCLWTLPAGGGPELAVLCADELPGLGTEASVILAWSSEGHLLVQTYSLAGAVVYDVDVRDALVRREVLLVEERGRAIERSFHGLRQARAERDDGARLVWNSELARIDQPTSLEDGGTAWVLQPHGPEGYAFGPAQWSPDGGWVLVEDSAQRLIVLGADGTAPRLLATNATSAAWYVPGHDRYTVDIDHLR